MTIFLATPSSTPELVRVPVAPVKNGTPGFATVDLRSPLTSSHRPDAAAPLGGSGRWF